MSMELHILDSTLREGEQTPGVSFDIHIKVAIAKLLDEIGIHIIEAGHASVTEDIRRAIMEIGRMGLRSITGAHARSAKADVDLALSCRAGFLGIFYCVSEQRLRHHNRTLTSAVDRICDTIAYARSRCPSLTIRYTPEDTVRSEFNHVVEASVAACDAGADIISVADTTGHMIPGTGRSMFDFISRLKDALLKRNVNPRMAVHCHNDRGLALANTLDAFRAGATILDASTIGLGERAGITDLASLLTVLAADFGYHDRWNLARLPELYALVSRFSGIPIPVHHPVTGQNAFTHCAGVHTQAAIRNPLHYESLSPAFVGREPTIALDHMAGMSAVRHCLDLAGEEITDADLLKDLLAHIKTIGQTGRTVAHDELKLLVSYLRQKRLAAQPLSLQ